MIVTFIFSISILCILNVFSKGRSPSELILRITSKFDWMPDDIRTEKIISALIWAC